MLFEKQILDSYKNQMHTRCDDTETVFYYSHEDFAGLHRHPFPFPASAGHTLQGYLYAYDSPKSDRLIVFDHGFGGGHRAYMKEIELLCRHGYRVLAYDHTGCMESGGDTPGGMAHSLCDLNDCLCAVKADAHLSSLSISVMGHSWGGFAALNISPLHPDVSHVVVLSGFVSVEELIKGFFPGLLRGFRKPVMKLERASNPVYVNANAIESLKNSTTKALLIYSKDDALCNRHHFDLLKSAHAKRPNTRFMLLSGKGHNPNYTTGAVARLREFTSARAKLLRKPNLTDREKAAFVASFDWNAMTAQDESVWSAIFSHLDS